MGWLESILLAAFTAGVAGGLHCAGMCGGIVGMLHSCRGTRGGAGFVVAYNTGRIASYVLAGALAGMAGQAGLLLRGAAPVQHLFLLMASLMLFAMALYLAGVAPLMRRLEAVGSVLWRQIQPFARHLIPADTAGKAFGLGIIWGWLPCGMVYAVLLLALSTGNALEGALVMFAFGLGTLPHMLVLGGAAQRLRLASRHRVFRLAAAGALTLMGGYVLLHAAGNPASALDSLFCRLPSG